MPGCFDDRSGINCADYGRSQRFYDRVLGVLDYSRQLDFGEAIGYGPEGQPDFWIAEGAGTGPNRETHFAFAAVDHDPDGNNVEAVCHG
jgi:catechol 2,3-dioxygenase-like lactoylglutathione lyase family enzyme